MKFFIKHPFITLFLFIMIGSMFAGEPSQTSGNNSSEDRTITDPYYALVSYPELSDRERQLLKCLKADDVIAAYENKGDNDNADYWRNIKKRECRRLSKM